MAEESSANVVQDEPKEIDIIKHDSPQCSCHRTLDMLTSPIVTIIAGKEQKRLLIHAHLFTNSGSPVLAALVNQQWKEGNEKVIDWTSQDLSTVLSVINYLYCPKCYGTHYGDKLAEYHTNSPEEKTENSDLYLSALHQAKVSIFADIYHVEDLVEMSTFTLIRELDTDGWTYELDFEEIGRLATHIYDNTPTVTIETPLQAVVTRSIVERLLDSKSDDRFDDIIFGNLIKKYPSLGINVALRMRKMTKCYNGGAFIKNPVLLKCRSCHEVLALPPNLSLSGLDYTQCEACAERGRRTGWGD